MLNDMSQGGEIDALTQFALDTGRRARWVLKEGIYEGWSTGELLAVALVLRDKEMLDAEGYTPQQAAQRVHDGLINPPSDFAAWLNGIRATLYPDFDSEAVPR